MKNILFIALACIIAPLSIGAQTIRHISITGNERTRTYIIKRELLFAVGSRLDSALVAETERNLRLLPYLGNAEIEIAEIGDQVDISIRVSDLYSRALAPLLSGAIDELNYGLVGLDYNLAGRGQSLRFAVENRAISGRRGELDYQQQRLYGTRHEFVANAAIADEGHDFSLSLSRPFATLDSRQSYGINLSQSRAITRLYSAQNLAARYRNSSQSARLWYSPSYGRESKIRPRIEMRYLESDYTALGTSPYAPNDRHRIQTTLGLLAWRPRYTKTTFVHDLGPVEDLQTGSWLVLRGGLSLPLGNRDRLFALNSLQLSPRWMPTPRTYVFSTLFGSAQYRRGAISNAFLSAQTRVYTRLGAAHSLALRARWDLLHRAENNTQLLLGLDTGLRAYPTHRFDGKRRLVMNVEFRPSFVRSFWYTLAGALFVDIGAAWIPGETSPHLRYGPGWGLRLGLPRIYGTPVWRLDLAYAVDEQAGRLSIGMGQYF
ncbi:MAG: outer membrane protein assembly factor BamA [Candidatus Latescibacterota bacterium]